MSTPSPAIDPSPLLSGGRRRRHPSLRVAARLLRSRRLRPPSIAVRETAAAQLEERQSGWARSSPVLVLDLLWNLAFVGTAASTVALSWDERPAVPLRVWVGGYVAQCVLHMVCVGAEYWRRGRGESGGLSSPRLVPDQTYGSGEDLEEDNTSLAKHLENTNTMFSFIWWIIGFYWVSAGGQALTRDSPQLYGLCIVFLAFDVFFLVFCVALACIVGIAVCCCLPCIIAILYAVADQDGATDEDIRQLPKYKFRRIAESEKDPGETSGRFGGIVTESGSDPPIEHVLSAEDAGELTVEESNWLNVLPDVVLTGQENLNDLVLPESDPGHPSPPSTPIVPPNNSSSADIPEECCICLSAYDDGVELRELPCGHHFHCACIDKWLYINATCPLCKYDILNSGSRGVEEV